MSSTALAARTGANVIQWNERQLATMKRTIAVDATNDEFDMFVNYCIAKGLDPFTHDAILVIYGKGSKDQSKRKPTIITTQAGMRKMAARAGGYHPAKPGDTVWSINEYETERQRYLNEAARIFDKPARDARLLEINTNMPVDPVNPYGLVECRTKIYKHGEPVEGIAFWQEFAPLTPSPECFEWVGTGDYFENRDGSQGKERKRRRIKQGINPADHMILDTSGQWGSGGRNMLSKCANVNALKAGYPDQFDHRFQTEETMERMAVADRTASELAEIGEQERRQHAIGQSSDEYAWTDGKGSDGVYPANQFGDAVMRTVRACKYREDFDSLMAQRLNKEYFNRFWATHKNDALDVKAEFEAFADRLPKRPAAVTIDHDAQEGVPAHA